MGLIKKNIYIYNTLDEGKDNDDDEVGHVYRSDH